MRTYQDAKAMAKALRASLASRSVSLSHSYCLEIVANQFGFADWNTLSANLNVTSPVQEDLSCSFCDKPQHEVQRLIEGGCSNRGKSACVFICAECVALCAQINADPVGNAASDNRARAPVKEKFMPRSPGRR